jgi:hypothetical protein
MFELLPRPADRLLRPDIESVRVEERPLVVVAEDHEAAAIANDRGALARIGAVADDIAEAIDGVHPLPVDILEHRAERLEIAVNVADDGPLHSCSIPLAGPGIVWESM